MVTSAKIGTERAKVAATKSAQPVLGTVKKSHKSAAYSRAKKPADSMPKLAKKSTKATKSLKTSANTVEKLNKTAKKAATAKSSARAKNVKAAKSMKSAKSAIVMRPVEDNAQRSRLHLKKRRYSFASHKQPTFSANPLAEYADSWGRKRRKKRYIPRRRRIERQIMIMLACFSVSIGLWENFRQLWLQGNG